MKKANFMLEKASHVLKKTMELTPQILNSKLENLTSTIYLLKPLHESCTGKGQL
jgi:hypothetical protein